LSTSAGAETHQAARCARCSTELAPGALSCPSCGALVHAEALKAIAAEAETAKTNGDLLAQSAAWQRALDLLPFGSQQHTVITERLAAITRDLSKRRSSKTMAVLEAQKGKGIGAVVGAVAILLLSKLKFLLLGLTKLKTVLSMLAFFGVYWSIYGWAFAAGLVLTIYIHEMGHVYVLRRLGIEASAPMFIPGFGAFIVSKRRFDDPSIDARVGLGGPIWGLGAGLVALLLHAVYGTPVLGAIAAVTGFINLFNLIPIWQLDGSHAYRALHTMERWILVGAVGLAYYWTHQGMLLAIGAVGLFRAFQKTEYKGDRSALATYVALVFALAWLSGTHVAQAATRP
jgi:Zn-dependent protease